MTWDMVGDTRFRGLGPGGCPKGLSMDACEDTPLTDTSRGRERACPLCMTLGAWCRVGWCLGARPSPAAAGRGKGMKAAPGDGRGPRRGGVDGCGGLENPPSFAWRTATGSHPKHGQNELNAMVSVVDSENRYRVETQALTGRRSISQSALNHGLLRPFRAWIGGGRANPRRCPGLACVAPLALPGHGRHRRLGAVAWVGWWISMGHPLAGTRIRR